MANTGYSQDGLNAPVKYEAKDSIVANIPKQIVQLYGEAIVEYEDIRLTADYIEINLTTNEVTATYQLDSLNNPIGKPVFSSAGEESKCDYMKYNFNTKQGYIKEVRAQQGEGYIHMAESKILPNEEIHLKDGKFTTCDADTPHYHFKLTKAIIVPDKRIVTGPVYMKLFRIPTPLAAPFAFLPNSESKKHGLIIPSIGNAGKYGFGLQNLGYYIPLGAYWDTRFYGSIFTSGRFMLENQTSYYQKYKYRGDFGVKFEQFRGKFYDTLVTNKWTLRWKHTQDAKAHPSLKFSTDINFKSDNNGKTSLEAVNSEYFDNQFNSAINITKRWRTNNFSGSMGVKTSLQQNSVTGNYSIDLPSYNLSVSRFDLGVLRNSKIGSSPLDKIYVTYSMNARNFINAPDSIFNKEDLYLVSDYALSGVQQNVAIQSNLRLFGGRFTFTPSANYKEYWNFQSEEQEWDDVNDTLNIISNKGFKTAREVSFTGGLVSNFFGYYKLKGERQVKFRHVASPSLSFSYRPDIFNIYQEVQTDSAGTFADYSPFQNSLYRGPGQGESGVISFNLANTFEMKKRDMKDTLNETMKSFKLIDQLSLGGSYDIFKDSLNLSNISINFRTSRFLGVFSFQSSAVLSPYGWIDSSGVDMSDYAWKNEQGIGRIKNSRATLNANFTNKNGRKKQNELKDKYQDDANSTDKITQNGVTSFEIPWQLNLSYNINYNRLSLANYYNEVVDSFNLVQTLRADGDFNLGKKWKFTYLFNYDLQAGAVTNYNLGIWRDLHCWEARLEWGQYGKWSDQNFTFLFRVNIKASMFQDIKLEYTQPPIFF